MWCKHFESITRVRKSMWALYKGMCSTKLLKFYFEVITGCIKDSQSTLYF